MPSWRRVFTSDEARIEALAGASPRLAEVALADADYVLRWLQQCRAPENIVGLQARVVAVMRSAAPSDWPMPSPTPNPADDEDKDEPC